MEICERCGLPKEACICKELIKSQQKIKIEKTRRRYNKFVTLISGIDKENIKEIAKKLKTELIILRKSQQIKIVNYQILKLEK